MWILQRLRERCPKILLNEIKLNSIRKASYKINEIEIKIIINLSVEGRIQSQHIWNQSNSKGIFLNVEKHYKLV